jgi:hypothetical protein
MLAMLTDMKLVPHRHFGMPGNVQEHTLVYTIVFAICLTVFFDLSRIASLGVIFYMIMDIAVHLGILRKLRKEIKANVWILSTAIILDLVVLGGFLWIKIQHDTFIVWMSILGISLIFIGEYFFIRKK